MPEGGASFRHTDLKRLVWEPCRNVFLDSWGCYSLLEIPPFQEKGTQSLQLLNPERKLCSFVFIPIVSNPVHTIITIFVQNPSTSYHLFCHHLGPGCHRPSSGLLLWPPGCLFCLCPCLPTVSSQYSCQHDPVKVSGLWSQGSQAFLSHSIKAHLLK